MCQCLFFNKVACLRLLLQVQEMPLRTLPEKVVFRNQVDKGEVLSRHRYKETRILLINTIAFS